MTNDHDLSFIAGIRAKLFRKSWTKTTVRSSGPPEGLCRRFSLREIKAATNNFDPKLRVGEGGYDPVYRGTLESGKLQVAVKRLASGSLQSSSEFHAEVILLCQIRHRNIIPLVGFCDERGECIIVYPYMLNGSLNHHIYGQGNRLPWERRLKICIGAARGLHYLHAGAKRAVIHRDVKTSNILLDENLDAKLSDFGLAKLGPRSMSRLPIKMEVAVMGTFGYVAPEYMATGELTEKSDVYSFGVVLLEVLCGRRVFERTFHDDREPWMDWARNCVENGNFHSIVDQYLSGGKIAPLSLKNFVEIACDCSSSKAEERPTMGEVEMTLELALELHHKYDSALESTNPNGEPSTNPYH